MDITKYLLKTPWDARALHTDTYEILTVSDEILSAAAKMHGHFTVKISPLDSKEVLHRHGFYYCDTLLEPYCTEDRLKVSHSPDAAITQKYVLDDVLRIADKVFIHGRFHRDFNVDKQAADERYNFWIKDLHAENNLFAFCFRETLCGFCGIKNNKLVLHAMSAETQGKGLAKFFWSALCLRLFHEGHREISSSVSASNSAVVNLYASLGFRFRNPVDIYHRLNI